MMEERKYYPYKMIGELVNADNDSVIEMLKAMDILSVEKNPDTTVKLGKICVNIKFRAREKELYKLYFREYFIFKNGKQHFIFEITDEFVEFVRDIIEKEGCMYNVQFK